MSEEEFDALKRRRGVRAPGEAAAAPAVQPKPRRRMDESESQARLIAWARETCEMLPRAQREALSWLHAVPNGANLGKAERAKIYREGRTRGVWDLFLPCRRDGHAGLYVEMKSRTGTLSPEQKAFGRFVRDEGYRVAVCRSWQHAARVVVEYLDLRTYAPIDDSEE